MSVKLPDSAVIFGCGYVGGELARRLVERGVRVAALTRNPETAGALRSMGLSEVVEAELQTKDWHAALRGDYEAVVNCVSSAGGGLEGYRRSYLEGQVSILDWLGPRRLRRYLYTGSTSVYPQDDGGWVDERADTSQAPPTGRVLLESEALLRALDPRRVERWYVFRLSGIYGPGRHYLIDQVREHAEAPIPGRGDYALNMIHRDDVVSALLRALDPESSAPSGIYNLSDDRPATKEAVVRWLAGQLGRPAPGFDPSQVPPRLARRGGRMPDRRISNAKAKRAFGWTPRYDSFEAGYRGLL